ncbi:FBOX protein [Geosmithia morbida]|uniref:FBOX protein n=1 Tax=Geosmithia morbida TaxID=1094350 RepID=A0A9P5D007_9HYPO|nr:FBOX protein [Geosmithia morbida]KAF4121097.1 FBOX protein [Geosmithia morbida]
MDTLPMELLAEVLAHVPSSTRRSTRLTCRSFWRATPLKADYAILASFVDPAVAQATVEATAADVRCRSHAIWSPRCRVPPSLVVPEGFLLALYAALSGRRWAGAGPRPHSDGRHVIGEDETISADAMARDLGRDDVTEDNVRQAMFRYTLYLSYLGDGGRALLDRYVHLRMACGPSKGAVKEEKQSPPTQASQKKTPLTQERSITMETKLGRDALGAA